MSKKTKILFLWKQILKIMKINDPLISICCLTYNHENYIEDAINGFLMQKTEFKFEILIHDDASKDKTSEIIKKYEKKYPDLIKPIYQKENQYSKGVKPIFEFLFPRAKGKYIALCEGDDYWTDPYKLQKQVDFLEKHEEFNGIATNSLVITENNDNFPFGIKPNRQIKTKELILSRQFATCTLLFRNNINIPPVFSELIVGDTPLFILLNEKKPIYYTNEITSVYRYGSQGITKTLGSKKNLEGLIKLYHYINKITKLKYKRIISKKIYYISSSEYKVNKKKLLCYKYSEIIDSILFFSLLKILIKRPPFFFDIALCPFYKKIIYIMKHYEK